VALTRSNRGRFLVTGDREPTTEAMRRPSPRTRRARRDELGAVTSSWVPVVSLADHTSAVRAVADACERVGFLTIVDHGVPDAVIGDLWDTAHAFFDLPEASRRAVAMPYPGYPYGWSPFAYETLTASLGETSPPDLKQSFAIGPVDPPSHAFADPDEASAWSPNRWPDDLPAMRPAWERAYRTFAALAARLLSIMAEALRLPPEHFTPLLDRHTSAMRALDYPALDRAPLAGQLRAGAHTDYGTLTILVARHDQPGLQVQRPDGSWAPADPVPGGLVVNLGDAMARWTNDRWRSTMHRVVVPGGDPLAGARRQSIAFFHNANWDARIECIPTCLAPGERPRYAPIDAGPHLMAKFRSTVGG
jgi:isopenicillin N synthase-like dioxygenase